MLLLFSSFIFLSFSKINTAQLQDILERYRRTDKAKWENLVQFLSPRHSIINEPENLNFQKMMLEARGLSPEKAQSESVVRSLKEYETKRDLEKWVKDEFKDLLNKLYHKMRNRIDARKNYVEGLVLKEKQRKAKQRQLLMMRRRNRLRQRRASMIHQHLSNV